MQFKRIPRGAFVFVLLGLILFCQGSAARVSITTSSDEARELYLQARDLFEKLRFTDAREMYLKALEKDPDFALAHLGVANTSTTANEFFQAIDRAVELSEGVSEGERLMILGTDAAARSKPARQGKLYSQLVEKHPDDERARGLLGNYLFGIQDYKGAIAQYEKGIAINPDYSPIYNMLGYAYRFTHDFERAERAFKKYIELIPDEPNPYDSYAELLMKMGRFQESIANYEMALKLNSNFVPSYVGIALNQILAGKGDEARETLGKLQSSGRTVAERRQAIRWIALSFVFEDNHDAALKAADSLYSLAVEDNDMPTMSADQIFMGNILLDAGKTAEALARFQRAVEIIEKADVLDEVKETTGRNHLYFEARVRLAQGDLNEAKTLAQDYMEKAQAHGVPFEVRQAHELAAMIALDQGDPFGALQQLHHASRQNPRVLYLMALAYRAAKNNPSALGLCEQAAHFNGINFNYAYVRPDALALLEVLTEEE